ncbi:M14 family zinc carboxypeptidase [Ornithinimicrobium pratense]|uniref:Peptidase M28 n=1 Tax=Ornithinimicrobium pratense TaxID=2593973 RepID=A0A5J6V3L8_9MICO|nr:M14 family zinc carboxypeptidase [Ornithinimicrobium pratense]QFG67762.1 peptidase M28 [Ornithinimicrobium pratense]
MTRARRPMRAVATATALGAAIALAPLPSSGAGLAAHPGSLDEPAVEEQDASLRLGLAAYHDLHPMLNDLAQSSDRVSVEVIGSSAQGRDLLLVTLTAPESTAQTHQQDRMRELITDRPARAARDQALARNYKVPIFVNANIHGNEWEGTDAALRLVEDYATSDDPGVEAFLASTRIHLLLSANPDGRVEGDRRNAHGFDLNRDLITATQPETVALREALIRTQPALVVDLHGYVNGTLVEPTTPPHGDNYEFDLLVRHSYPLAVEVERAIEELAPGGTDGVRPVQIPLRDWEQGWDGWPPIFVPQYAALHGAVAHTVELPLRVNGSSYDLPEDELRRRASVNTDIARAALTATVEYAVEHRTELLADHIEIFRRAAAGERQRPVEEGLFGVIGPEDVYTTDFPRAYVIPAGEGQRSAPAAARLVDHLVANDVEVTRLGLDTSIAGRSYPAGSYVVDLHQAKRAVANAILGRGADLTDRVEAMYDISGWSLGQLWGADVVTVPERYPLRLVGTEVESADPTGDLAESSTGWVLPMADPADVQAVSTLLGQGIPVELLADGSVLVPYRYPWAAGNVTEVHGVILEQAPADAAGEPLAPSARVVGVAGTAEERWAFAEMGLTVEPISTRSLNAGLDLSGLDALYVSSGMSWRELGPGARAELRAFVEAGGGFVGRGSVGAEINDALDLLDVAVVPGRADANGVVRVASDPASPVTSAATEHTFVYSPYWFTRLGPDVRADQRLTADPLVSGHWAGGTDGGQEAAVGQALVVSGETAAGTRAVLFGSEPLFRAHPKGQYALVGRAVLWAGSEGAPGTDQAEAADESDLDDGRGL